MTPPIGAARAGVVGAGGVIPDSAVSQYDATQLTGLSDGNTVNTWEDQIGTNDATSSGTPTYRANQINGNPAVEFDGSGDFFDTTYSPNTDNNLTGISVVYFRTPGQPQAPFGALDSNLDSRFEQAARDNSGPNDYNPAYGDSNATAGTVTRSQAVILTLRNDSGTARLREDGTEVTNFSFISGGQSDATVYLGARDRQDGNPTDRYLDGFLCEAVFYDGLSDTGRDSEESRIATKWGITI